MNFEARKLSLKYIKAELRWYLHGDPTDLSIARYAKLWETIADHSGKVNSNYGHYIFRRAQFEWIISELRSDPDSRRASLVILQPEHLVPNNKDVPCTYGMNFRVREGKLNCSVHMRSQDAIWGLGNDLPFFSVVQELAATLLLVPMGNLHLVVDSFHVYEKHFDMVDQIVSHGSRWSPIECPRIFSILEANRLICENPDMKCPFTKWLYGDKVRDDASTTRPA